MILEEYSNLEHILMDEANADHLIMIERTHTLILKMGKLTEVSIYNDVEIKINLVKFINNFLQNLQISVKNQKSGDDSR